MYVSESGLLRIDNLETNYRDKGPDTVRVAPAGRVSDGSRSDLGVVDTPRRRRTRREESLTDGGWSTERPTLLRR